MAIPKGFISIWYGAAGSVPWGWHICDGTAGTVDLRDKFLMGAGVLNPPGAESGSMTHTHPFTSDGHVHDIPDGDAIETGFGSDDQVASAVDTGTTDAGSSLPPYHALYYIMKL